MNDPPEHFKVCTHLNVIKWNEPMIYRSHKWTF